MEYEILVVDDDMSLCLSFKEMLEGKGFKTRFTTEPEKAVEIIKKNKIALGIFDIRMQGLDGIELLQLVKDQFPELPVIIISGHATVDLAVTAMKYGALNFYTKPVNIKGLISDITRIFSNLPSRIPEQYQGGIITADEKVRHVLERARKVAVTDATVLISGESGTGKEMIADVIHEMSRRKEELHIKINCAAIPDSLLESELFGYEKGAFTDARQQKKGKFEIADKGTIFLDEIGDISIKLQAKLLRVLQEKTFERLGGNESLTTGCRVIAATNRNLKEMIAEKSFRDDLYYRLSVVNLKLPPLRERREDIMIIANNYLRHYNEVYNKNISGFSEKVINFLLNHNWPGNIRELKNFMESTVIFADGLLITERNMPEQYQFYIENTPEISLKEKEFLATREIIQEALIKSGGVKYKAAEYLNITRKTLYNRMKQLGME